MDSWVLLALILAAILVSWREIRGPLDRMGAWMGWQVAGLMLEHRCRTERPAAPGPLPPFPASASYGLWQHLDARPGYAQVLDVLAQRYPGRCEVCGAYRAACLRCRYLDGGQPSPVGCTGERW